MKKKLNGLIICLIIAISSYYISIYLHNIGIVSISLILGIIIGNFFTKKINITNGINFTEKKILPIAIGFLGVELNFEILHRLGYQTFFFIVALIAFTILSALFWGKIIGFSKKLSLLIGIGNAVCGSSAIAATAPIIENNEEEIGLSIGIVNFLGTIGIFLMPLIANYFNLIHNSSKTGILIGGTLQAVGQVVASGYSVNNDVGTISVLIKMIRILLLGPLIILLIFLKSYLNKNKNINKTNNKSKIKVPFFIILFFLFSLISSSKIINIKYIEYIKLIGKFLLVFSMAAIGLKIKLSHMIKKSPKYFLLGILIVITQVTFVLIYVFGG